MGNNIKSTRGFSLVEVLVGLGIVMMTGILMLASFKYFMQGSQLSAAKGALNIDITLLQKILSKTVACTNAIDKTVAIPLDFTAPAKFDVSITAEGFGLLKSNSENAIMNLFVDEFYIDDPVFLQLGPANEKIFIGLLKIKATQRIFENGTTVRGLKFSPRTLGAISISFNDAKMILDCKMSPRSL